jgi:hypothetical protein
MADPSTRMFRASLRGRLSRDIELPSGKSLEDLAAAIVGAFGFDLDHAFGFYSNFGGAGGGPHRDIPAVTPDDPAAARNDRAVMTPGMMQVVRERNAR